MKPSALTKLFLIGIVISSVIFFPFILDPTLTPRFITLAASVSLGIYMLYKSETSFTIKADIIFLSYASYTLFCCFSILWSNTSSEALFESSKQLLNLFVFLITYFFLKRDQVFFVNTLLKISIGLFTLIFILAIYQILGLTSFDKESIYNIKSLQGHKNLLSSFLFLLLFFLIAACYKLTKAWKITAVVSIFLCLGLLFFLRTKAVWTGLAIAGACFGIAFLFTKTIKDLKSKIVLAVPLLIFILFLNIFFMGFLQPLIQKSISYTSQTDSVAKILPTMKLEQERLILWDKTYHLIHQKPLIGVGMGNWQVHLPDATLSGLWRGEDLNYTFQRPHNDFLWLLSEIGLIGFNLFLMFLGCLIFFALKTLRIINDKVQKLDLIFCISFIVGYYTISFFDFPRERMEHGIWINLILGFTYYLIKSNIATHSYINIKANKNILGIACLVILFIAFVGILRFNGEFFMRRLLIYKSANRLQEVVSSGKSAQSFAYQLDATSVPISWYTGNAKASLGKFEEAQKDFIHAYKVNPFNKNVLNDLGSSYVYTNDVLRAKFYYEEAARISPRYDEPKLNLASIYINAKDFKTASFWLKSILHDSERRKNYEQLIKFVQQP